MTTEEFTRLLGKLTAEEDDLLARKGRDYTRGSPDRLANFKQKGAELASKPSDIPFETLKVWYVYASKHWDAIVAFIKLEGQSESEPIRERVKDMRNYLALFLGLISDLNLGQEKK